MMKRMAALLVALIWMTGAAASADYVADPIWYETQEWLYEMLDVPMEGLDGVDGTGIRIAILDTGINAEHENLALANIEDGWNYLNESDRTTDYYGHGTFIAGLIAAQPSGDCTVWGFATGATLIPLKCIDDSTAEVGVIVEAIYDAVDVYACDILCMSWGIDHDSSLLRQAVNYAAENGVIIVASVGNKGSDVLYYPAAYEQVIGVGAVNEDEEIASYSQTNESVTLVTPGTGLRGLGHTSNRSIKARTGTSYSTAIAVAAVALYLQCYPDADLQQVLSAIETSCKDLGDEGYDEVYGWGLLDIQAMLAAGSVQE